MAEDNIEMLIQVLGEQIAQHRVNPAGTVSILISETVKFRDKLKEDTGVILTVADTRAALDALEGHLGGQELPKTLTSEQRALAQIYIDRLTLFGDDPY